MDSERAEAAHDASAAASNTNVPLVVAIASTPAPYRAHEFDQLQRELAGRYRFHLMFLEQRFRQMGWKDDLPHLATWETLPLVRLGPLNYIPGLRRVNRGVRARLDALQPCAVILHGYDAPALWTARSWALQNGRGVLFRSDSNAIAEVARGRLLWRSFIKKPVLHRFFAGVGAFLTAGTANENYFRMFGADERRFFRCSFTVDEAKFAAAAERQRQSGRPLKESLGIRQRTVLLFVGRLIWEKDLPVLMEAFRRVAPDLDDVALVLAGDGPMRGRLEQLAAPIRDRVYFLGFRQPDELGDIYGIADVFILPSRSEQWGLVINEAMAAGVPCIAADDVGAAPDLVIPGQTGWQFRTSDTADLQRALREALAPGVARAPLAANARALMQEWTRLNYPPRVYVDALTYAVKRNRP